MALDGLEDAYDRGRAMGVFAESCVTKYGFSREAQDEFAITSTARSKRANEDGSFEWEIAPVVLQDKKGPVTVSRDEQPFKAKIDKIPSLKPAFKKDGTITAANASSISDGAAALVLMREGEASRRGLKPLARIAAWATAGVDPAIMGTGPIPASRKALEKAGWKVGDLDLVESNEAFAAQSLCVLRDLGLDPDKVNVNGGAIAIGHPIGASGARILTTLLHEMRRSNASKGLATLCVGGGMGVAMCVEKM
jgi:acetyl-CoA C-acetyltransferase